MLMPCIVLKLSSGQKRDGLMDKSITICHPSGAKKDNGGGSSSDGGVGSVD